MPESMPKRINNKPSPVSEHKNSLLRAGRAARASRFALLLILVFVISTLAPDAEARRHRHRRRSRGKRAPIINEKKLYERIGGGRRLTEIVDEWMRLNLADSRVSPAFSGLTAKPDRLAHERRNLTDQLCELSDGPCVVKDEPVKKGKPPDELILNSTQFIVFGDNLVRALQKYQVVERDKNELLGRFGEAKADFVEGAKAPDRPDIR